MTPVFTTAPFDAAIIGPYSQWPRKPQSRRRIALAAGGAASVGVFLHCIAPMIVGF